ncbi:hypothetical protein F4780DRAFT_206569 [Xylariomycetidae sp. FL0641]|nr:hypothetical protein F4780DRAFT_206569 [Xylariomycetidae sp. FL0641]
MMPMAVALAGSIGGGGGGGGGEGCTGCMERRFYGLGEWGGERWNRCSSWCQVISAARECASVPACLPLVSAGFSAALPSSEFPPSAAGADPESAGFASAAAAAAAGATDSDAGAGPSLGAAAASAGCAAGACAGVSSDMMMVSSADGRSRSRLLDG